MGHSLDHIRCGGIGVERVLTQKSLTQTTAHDALEQAAEKTRAVVRLRKTSKIVSESLFDLPYDALPAASREHLSTLIV